jgi:chemotaxis protein methyltransferase WspC
MTRIESLLRKEIGLDAASIGSSLIERTVRLRMKALGLKKADDYERLLKTSSTALEELIEAVVVTETWFFRDRDPFVAFVQMARQWLLKNPAGTLRALSVPCSSGEEPYSLAMALLDVPLSPHRFVIDGVDISARALARAKQAVYGRNSFRGRDLAFRERHFRHTKDGYTLNPAVRESVRFHRDNLLGEDFLSDRAPYDFIFCRNLLIYFDRATQVRALEKLHRLLNSEGMLFVGPAELPLVAGNGFASANLPMVFACRKVSPKSKVQSLKSELQSQVLSPESRVEGRAQPLHPGVRQQSPSREQGLGSPLDPDSGDGTLRSPLDSRPTAAHATTKPLSDLEVARQLADAGRLADAAAICETHVRKEGPSAQAYYLLGLLSDANGDPKASDYYRKALYLEPNHYETLLQMTLLLEKSGDKAAARSYKRRAERQKPR